MLTRINSLPRCLFALAAFALLGGALQAQTMQVAGKVVDENNEGVIGATVRVKGGTTGVITDFDGAFSLQVNPTDSLHISYVGYDDIYIGINGRSYIDINLVVSNDLLEEVVVIGYGTTKSKNFTGSVDVVKINESPIADMGLTNVTDLLRGRMSGVIMSSGSGMVGESSSIQIRGKKSISSTSEEPLIILNGVIFSGSLDDIDPNSIESVSALKDATSLAAYGSKAANGVIMVTTKKGVVGKPVINFSTSHSFSGTTYKQKFLDGEGYIRYRNAKAGNSDLTDTSWMTAIERKNYDAGQETDWYDLCTRTGYDQTYSLNVSGASEQANYYIGGSHSDMSGMVKGNDFVRNNLNINITTNIAKWFKVGGNMNFTTSKKDGVSANVYNANQSPYGDPYLPDGRWRKFVEGGDVTATNPLWSTYNGVDNESNRTNFVIGGFASFDIPQVPGLNFRVNASYTKINSTQRHFEHESSSPTLLVDDIEGVGYAPEYQNLANANGYSNESKQTNWVMDYILSYAHTFGDNDISASLVYTRDSHRIISEHYEGSNFQQAGNTILGWYGLANAANKNFTSPTYLLHNDVGYLGRIMYAYKGRYHANFSLRRDGSSVFGSKNKWGNFPAVGLAWTMTGEKWMQDIKWLDNLKVKASWGKNGAQTLAPYGSLTKISVANDGGISYYPNGVIAWGQAISTLGNPELAWQTTTSWGGGFEADMLKRRLHFELNLYSSKTTDQIFDRTIPIMTAGISTQKATMGQVDNKGIEINASSTNIKGKNFSWTSDYTFTLNRNKLVELYDDGQDDLTNQLFIGEPLSAIYGYRNDGIFQDGPNAGTPIFITASGEQTANPSSEDRTILGYRDENFRITWSNTFKYKDFQLYFLLSGIFGGGNYGLANNTSNYQTYATLNRCNAFDVEFWTPDNHSNKAPSPSYANGNGHYQVFDSYGHVRLQNVSLSYNLTKLAKAWGFANCRVAISGQNLFFFAPNWEGSDPESMTTNSAQGIPIHTLGLPRTFTMSFNITY